jgi:3-oxoacyl-[acyl-carrier protein] reductase/meso-butanediol dehydrogenase/(S,S)-butanediol dehydrogenase/diacetyl reductase
MRESNGLLAGKVAIVTGAGRMRGIGHDIALGLARAGADVAVTGTGKDPSTYPDDEKSVGWRDIDSVADEIRGLGRNSLPVVCDVSRSSDAQRTIAEVAAKLGRVDILINNAAAPVQRATVVEMAEDAWRRVIDVKLTGAFLMSQAAAKVMLAQGNGGRIVNISSVSSRFHSRYKCAYTAANLGMESLTVTMSKEVGPDGITVNSIVPGFFPTSRADYMRETEAWQVVLETISVRRPGTAEDMASMIVYLCSPAGEFITGQSIRVCGGQESHWQDFLAIRDSLEAKKIGR